jgi:hypothetical protein
MILWFACLLVTLVLLVYGICVALNQGFGKFRVAIALVSVLSATYIIYIPIFVSPEVSDRFFVGLIANFLNVLQTISLDAGSLEYQPVILNAFANAPFMAWVYRIILGIIHVLAPVVSFASAYTVLVSCVARLRLSYLAGKQRDVYIFSDASDVSVRLAKQISAHYVEEGERAEFVFCSACEDGKVYDTLFDDDKPMRKKPSEVTKKKRARRRPLFAKQYCCFLPDKITSVELQETKRGCEKKIHYYFFSDDEGQNMNDALEMLKVFSAKDKSVQERLYFYLRTGESGVEEMVDSVDKGLMHVRLVNEATLSVYRLLNEKPLYLGMRNKEISLLIAGLGRMGIEMLRAATWIGQIFGVKLKITALDPEAELIESHLKLQYPELLHADYNVTLRQVDFRSIEIEEVLKEYCADATYIAVCGDSDGENVATAMMLRRYYLRTDPAFSAMPFIAVYIRDDQKYEMVESLSTSDANQKRRASYELHPFGNQRSIYSYAEMMDSPIELLAMNIHMAYEAIFAPDKDLPLDAVQNAKIAFNKLEVNKSSSRAAALHIRYKLWLLGLDFEEGDPEGDETEAFLEGIGTDYLESLTFVEHDRWMAFQRSEGWRTATVKESLAYQASGVSKGRHNCPMLQMHPYICPFGDLPAVSEALGKEDATIYDRELIRLIPDILHDRWGATGRKYRIIKRNSEENQ